MAYDYDDRTEPNPRLWIYKTKLGADLWTGYDKVKDDRSESESKWISSLYAYKAKYENQIASDLRKAERSKIYARLLGAKIDTFAARIADFMAPETGEKWFGASPTPVAEPSPYIVRGVQQFAQLYAQQTGQMPSPEQIKSAEQKLIGEAALAMEDVIYDQFVEAHFYEIFSKALKSMAIYGTGIVKGVLTKIETVERWIPDQTGTQWSRQKVQQEKPFVEWVKLWDFFPDMNGLELSECRGVWQRHLSTYADVYSLVDRPDFNGEVILEYLSQYPSGDADLHDYETELRDMADDSRENPQEGKFELIEYWGWVKVEDLKNFLTELSRNEKLYAELESDSDVRFKYDREMGKQALKEGAKAEDVFDPETLQEASKGEEEPSDGMEEDSPEIFPKDTVILSAEMPGISVNVKARGAAEVFVNAYILGEHIVKLTVDPMQRGEFPYCMVYYRKDETSIFGSGIAELGKDAGAMANGALRAAFDNAAASMGPISVVNDDLLDKPEAARNLRGFSVLHRRGRTGTLASADALKIENVPSYTREFLELFNASRDLIDTVTNIPQWMNGSDKLTGGASTLGGMNMAAQALHVNEKDLIRHIDQSLIQPLVERAYAWNMEFNPDESIKGDYKVEARGTSAIIAKEVVIQSAMQLLQLGASFPAIQQQLDLNAITNLILKKSGLDKFQVKKSREQLMLEEQQAAQQQQQQLEMVQQVTSLSQNLGQKPEVVMQQIQQAAQQLQMIGQTLASQGIDINQALPALLGAGQQTGGPQ